MPNQDQVEIRILAQEHYAESMELSAFAFQYELSEEERRHREALHHMQEQWGAYVEGKLAAKLTILDFQCYMQGHSLAMGGIASVATWPEYRRGGLVTKLLVQALCSMKDKGQTLSFLYPFQYGFYRKFGWEMCAEHKQFEIATAQLPKWPHSPGKVVRTDRQWEPLHRIYSEYAVRFNGMLERSEAWWTHRVLPNKKGTAAIYYNEAGEPTGYVLYQVKERVLKVHELIGLTHEAKLGLWRFLADHDSMIERLTWNAPGNEALPFLLDNPRVKQEIVPTFMARIVDVPAFLNKYPFQSGMEGAFLLDIRDEHAPWNQGVWLVAVDEAGRAAVSSPEEAGDLQKVKCSIQTLSALLLGYQRPCFLQEIGRLDAPKEAVDQLERLVPSRPVFITDFF
ncbi:Predicted acetyltransferase [Paenibacillus sp. UNCCL117]|uniref:GNAT family N-acetyltransferase n=1 Tax=unclassified Paenibacillus TaxID=185978 RepID=UPI00087FCBF7|nr:MULTISPECIES: GNAT family N-acetyltransferase [unclassified Paenibacillus]SDE16327.1 Predicted acetyltransferase [Paenibacillus sp. cl123]SFW61134.1 Predicted acetyltransferase [Paenibacillus sp. UNCCL117]